MTLSIALLEPVTYARSLSEYLHESGKRSEAEFRAALSGATGIMGEMLTINGFADETVEFYLNTIIHTARQRWEELKLMTAPAQGTA